MGEERKSAQSRGKIALRCEESAVRDAHIVALRIEGFTLEKIGEAVGLRKTRVSTIVARELLHRATDRAARTAASVHLEELRLDALFAELWPKAMNGDGPSFDRLLKIMERRAKLLGLDAPRQVHHDVSSSEMDAEIERLLLDLAGQSTGPIQQ